MIDFRLPTCIRAFLELFFGEAKESRSGLKKSGTFRLSLSEHSIVRDSLKSKNKRAKTIRFGLDLGWRADTSQGFGLQVLRRRILFAIWRRAAGPSQMQPRQHASIFSAELNLKLRLELQLELKHMSIVFSVHYVGGMHSPATSVDRRQRNDFRKASMEKIRVSPDDHARKGRFPGSNWLQ